MENKGKDFKGIWVPREIMSLEIKHKKAGNLKLLLSMIISLEDPERGCYATNKYFAEVLNLSIGHISDMITYLFDNGLIDRQINQEKGNVREIRSLIKPMSVRDNTYTGKPTDPMSVRDNTYTGKPTDPIQENPIHDKKEDTKEENKSERDILPLIFLKNSFPEKFKHWKEDNLKKIFDPKDFEEFFNNRVELNNWEYNEFLITHLKESSRIYIKNQRESDRPARVIELWKG